MENKNGLFLGISIMVLILLAGFFLMDYNQKRALDIDSDKVVCTMDAFLCSDGSYVGRTGPNCQFAACPNSQKNFPQTISLRMGESQTALQVTISPIELLEDSRCGADVTCIWAGQVRVRVNLTSVMGKSNMIFTLNTPVTTEAEEITLNNVLPEKRSGVEVKTTDYIFVFEIRKR